MKHIVMAEDLRHLFGEKNSFLDRADIEVHIASTNDEVLKLHQKVKADLIITQLDMPGVRSESLFRTIREEEELKQVSTIIVCKDTLDHRERSKQCSANAVFTMPVDNALLQIKVQHFLHVAPRSAYRAVLAVAIQGRFKNKPLPFWTENISPSGMLIRAGEPLAVGDGVFFSFFLPDGTHACGYGEIARVVSLVKGLDIFHYGIRFTDVSPSVIAAIETTVKK
jgi:CheY-like chemotaxis protein